jgi:hypothetical protein
LGSIPGSEQLLAAPNSGSGWIVVSDALV